MQRTLNILALIITLNVNAQKAKLTGLILNPINDNSKTVIIYAKDYHGDGLYQWLSDTLGHFHSDSIKYGLYQFKFSIYKYTTTLDSVKIGTPNFDLKIPFPNCKNVNRTGICPICKKHDKVVKIEPHVIHDIWFKTTTDSLEYYKKQNSRGYEIDENKLIWVKNKKLEKKFYDPCCFWFCERDKEIF